MNETAVTDYIVNWITSYVKNTNGKIKSLVVGVSGGPDSLALSFLTKIYAIKKRLIFFIIYPYPL